MNPLLVPILNTKGKMDITNNWQIAKLEGGCTFGATEILVYNKGAQIGQFPIHALAYNYNIDINLSKVYYDHFQKANT